MREYLKSIPAATIIILYLFFCGGLYLIGYWQTFDIDLYSFVTIWDIPKNVIYPFSLASAVFIISEIFHYLFMYRMGVNAARRAAHRRRLGTNRYQGNNWLRKLRTIIYCFAILATLALNRYLWNNVVYWVTSSILIMLGVMNIFRVLLRRFRIYIPLIFLNLFLTLSVGTPLFCFIIGKLESLFIYNNAKVNTVNKKIIASTTDTSNIKSLKLVGFLGEKIIVSDLENEKIFILDKSGMSGIEINRRLRSGGNWWKFPNEKTPYWLD